MQIEHGWHDRLGSVIKSKQITTLFKFLEDERAKGHQIYPPKASIFAAFNLTPFEMVKVVIIGQDPYHGADQAHGLSFSVPSNVKIPRSLRNIFKELAADIGCAQPKHGNLESWARQGVLLLNSCLTVEKGKARSHKDKGWEVLTDTVIQQLAEMQNNLVFILWGRDATRKGDKIDNSRHLVLTAAHPSPLSACKGFFGSRPFSRTNTYLKEHGQTPIIWDINAVS